tara:strand:- start:248 stop:1012 length:765 start_codon:yes stop_codon:yes gene_type:complete
MSYLGRQPNFGQFRKVDVSSWTFNASNVSFPLGHQVGDVNQLIVSLNGVIQEPTADFLLQAGGNNLVFTTAPDSGDSCFAISIGGNAGDAVGTGSITEDKLAANLKTFDEFTRVFQGESDSCTLSFTPSAKGALLVSIDGVIQAQNNFTLVSNTISFDSALDSDSVLRVVDLGIKSSVFVPVDGSVTSSKLADQSVAVNNLDSSLVINNIPIRVNSQNIISSITIDSGKNASVVGPITVDSGVNIRVNGNFTVL